MRFVSLVVRVWVIATLVSLYALRYAAGRIGTLVVRGREELLPILQRRGMMGEKAVATSA